MLFVTSRRNLVSAVALTTFLLFGFFLPKRLDGDHHGMKLWNDVASDCHEQKFRHSIQQNCDGWNGHTIVIITSNARNFDVRAAQRDAFPSKILQAAGIKRVFLLAKDELVPEENIILENERNRDILQGSFPEDYHNLSCKHLMGLQWVTQSCSQATLLLKQDDDIMVDYFQLLDKLRNQYKRSLDNAMIGYKHIGLKPQRNPKSKWFVSKDDFPADFYPDFLSGWAYVTSTIAAKALVMEALRSNLFWIDDIWLTGMVAPKANIALLSLNSFYTVYVEQIECCLQKEDEPLFCDFAVGPSLNDLNLINRFGERALLCHSERTCTRRTWEKSIVKTCDHVKNPFFLPDSEGVGEVIELVSSNKM